MKTDFGVIRNRVVLFSRLSAITLLSVSSLSKLMLVMFYGRELADANPVFSPMPNWVVGIISAVIEALVVSQLFRRGRNPRVAGTWLLWLVSLIGAYRIGIWILAPGEDCHCLGLVGLLMGSSRPVEAAISLTLLIVLMITGLLMVLSKPLSCRTARLRTSSLGLLVGLVVLCIGYTTSLGFSGVAVSGSVYSEYFNSEGKKINAATNHFRVVRDGVGWEIHTDQAKADHYSIASDGVTTFTLLMSRDESREVDGATIDPVGYPMATPAEAIPWWFYILSKQTDESKTEIATPWSTPRSDPQSFFCKPELKWSDKEPFLLEAATFYFDADRVRRSMESPYLNRQSVPLASQSRILNLANKLVVPMSAGECSVLNWTNSELGSFPLEFRVVVYPTLSEQIERGEGKHPRIQYLGTITSISNIAKVNYQPSLRKPISVADFRFRDAEDKTEFKQYGPVDGWAINKNDVNLTGSRVVTRARDPISQMTIRAIIVVVLVGLTCIPLFLLWRRRMRATTGAILKG